MHETAVTAQTPRLDRLRPRVRRALWVRGWSHFEMTQHGDLFTLHARASTEDGPSLRVTLRFSEGGTVTMEGSGGSAAIADLRAEMREDAALAAALEGVL